MPDQGKPTFGSSIWGGAMGQLSKDKIYDIMRRRYELGFYDAEQKEEYEKWLGDNNPGK